MQERRQYPRLNVNLPVTLRYRGRLIPATALNISCGGMCLSTESPDVAGGGTAEVILDLSSTETDVGVTGRVVHVTPGSRKKIGIQFTNLYSVGHQAVERFVNKNRN